MLNRTTPRIEGPTSDSVAISAFNIFTIICISAEQVSVRFFFCFKKKEKKKRTRHHEAAQVPKIPYTIFILIWSRFFYRPTTASIAARTHYFKRRDKWTSRSSGSDARQHFHQLTSANELKKKKVRWCLARWTSTVPALAAATVRTRTRVRDLHISNWKRYWKQNLREQRPRGHSHYVYIFQYIWTM